jgi:subtilisin family serine protease
MPMRSHDSRLKSACRAALLMAGVACPVLAAPPTQPLPNDPLFYRQWGMENINGVDIDLLTAWKMIENEPKYPVTVAVIDTALDTTHADLKNRIHPASWDFVDDEANVFDGFIHHAHLISTIIAGEADNGKSGAGIAGTVPVNIMALQVFHISDLTKRPPWDEDYVQMMADRMRDAFQRAIDSGARVINVSTKPALPPEYYQIKSGEKTVQDVVAELWDFDGATAEERAKRQWVAWTARELEDQKLVDCSGDLCETVAKIIETYPDEVEARLESNVAKMVEVSDRIQERVDTEMADLVAHAKDNNVLIVAAAINVDPLLDAQLRQDFLSFPEPSPTADNIIKVSSMRPDGTRLETGEFGWSIHLYAPGRNIVNGMPQNDLALDLYNSGNPILPRDGTSFAAPHVAGIAALALSVRPNLTYQELRDALLAGSVELPGLAEQDSHNPSVTIPGRMIKAPLVLEQLGFELPGGRDAQGRPQAPVARIKLLDVPPDSPHFKYDNYQMYGISRIAGESVSFSAEDSSDLQGGIVSYEWSFGDGTVVTTTSPTVTHNFPNPVGGNYDVRVTVTDEQGVQDTSAPLRVKVTPTDVDWVHVSFGDDSVTLDGVLECGNFTVAGNYLGYRSISGSGRVRVSNGELVEVSINTNFYLLGYTNGTVTVDDLAGNVQTRSWLLRPTSWSPTPKRMSVNSSAVSWSVLDNATGTACQ